MLHERLHPNPMSPFFQKPDNQFYMLDRLSWIRQLHDRSISLRAAYTEIHEQVDEVRSEVRNAFERSDTTAINHALKEIRKQIEFLLTKHELNALVHHDLLLLKQLATACQNRLHSLDGKE